MVLLDSAPGRMGGAEGHRYATSQPGGQQPSHKGFSWLCQDAHTRAVNADCLHTSISVLQSLGHNEQLCAKAWHGGVLIVYGHDMQMV